MPRFGKDFKVYKRIVPSPYLDITDILETGWCFSHAVICVQILMFTVETEYTCRASDIDPPKSISSPLTSKESCSEFTHISLMTLKGCTHCREMNWSHNSQNWNCELLRMACTSRCEYSVSRRLLVAVSSALTRLLCCVTLNFPHASLAGPRECTICGVLASHECKDCYSDFGERLDKIAFCENCMKRVRGAIGLAKYLGVVSSLVYITM